MINYEHEFEKNPIGYVVENKIDQFNRGNISITNKKLTESNFIIKEAQEEAKSARERWHVKKFITRNSPVTI